MKARSVPFLRRTRYCSGVSSACHSASVLVAGEVVVVVGGVSVSLMGVTVRPLRVGTMTGRGGVLAPTPRPRGGGGPLSGGVVPTRPSACRPSTDARSARRGRSPRRRSDPRSRTRPPESPTNRALHRATPRDARRGHPSSGSTAGRPRRPRTPSARRPPRRLRPVPRRASRRATWCHSTVPASAPVNRAPSVPAQNRSIRSAPHEAAAVPRGHGALLRAKVRRRRGRRGRRRGTAAGPGEATGGPLFWASARPSSSATHSSSRRTAAADPRLNAARRSATGWRRPLHAIAGIRIAQRSTLLGEQSLGIALALSVLGDLERVQSQGMHGIASWGRSVSPTVVVRELSRLSSPQATRPRQTHRVR